MIYLMGLSMVGLVMSVASVLIAIIIDQWRE
jgi:hypothetical protein